MGKLGDKIKKEDIREEVAIKEEKKNVVKKISGSKEKDKQISAKVSSKVYANFTEINKREGLSNNSALNMLINRYVRENKHLLDDEI